MTNTNKEQEWKIKIVNPKVPKKYLPKRFDATYYYGKNKLIKEVRIKFIY